MPKRAGRNRTSAGYRLPAVVDNRLPNAVENPRVVDNFSTISRVVHKFCAQMRELWIVPAQALKSGARSAMIDLLQAVDISRESSNLSTDCVQLCEQFTPLWMTHSGISFILWIICPAHASFRHDAAHKPHRTAQAASGERTYIS